MPNGNGTTTGRGGVQQQPRRRGLGGLLSRLFQGRRDGRRAPRTEEGRIPVQETRFTEQGALRPGQPAERPEVTRRPEAEAALEANRQRFGGPSPLDPNVQLTQEATQRRQDTRFQFEEAKQELEQLQQAPKVEGPFARRRRMEALREAEARFARASVEAGRAAETGDILSEQEVQEREEGEQLQARLGRQGGLSTQDLARAKELGILDQLDPEEKARVERTALLDAPRLPGGSGQPIAVDRSRLAQLSAIDPSGSPINKIVGGEQVGVTQILDPQNVDEFLFNVSLQPEGTRNQIFQAISKAGGAQAIFESSGGNVSDALFLFGDPQPGGQFGAGLFEETTETGGPGTDLLEAVGVLFGGQPGFQGTPLPGATPLGIPGVSDAAGTSTSDQQFVQQNLLGSLFQLGFGGRGGRVPLPTGTFG